MRTTELGHQSFPVLRFKPEHWLFPSLQPVDLPGRYWGVSAFTIMWPVSYHKSNSVSTHVLLVLFPWRTLKNREHEKFLCFTVSEQTRLGQNLRGASGSTLAFESSRPGVRTAPPPPASFFVHLLLLDGHLSGPQCMRENNSTLHLFMPNALSKGHKGWTLVCCVHCLSIWQYLGYIVGAQ